jgi:hypothetical protein
MPTNTHSLDNTLGVYRTERGSNQRLVTLGEGPHERAHLALIPEASVLVGDRAEGARMADEIMSRPVLTDGDVIHVRGYDQEAYVAVRHDHNNDWWRLVPVGLLRFGRRFYVDFEGMDTWRIRDAWQKGATVDHVTLRDIGMKRINSLADAETAVERLAEESIKPTWSDYLIAIGHAVKA